ncbi:MAG: TIGR02266 family protein, partial [Deltaproteobacteria bacterium]|nr:TIGR02266 family protein [Deltaproteobacteria bacterium]
MSDADKRIHPRAKVLSMTVRYKSATVDEFVEHHSDNVSRGGIFIKTSSPFAAGTLLKFEIRIAADASVLTGVGRVVWKRDVAKSDEDPAGMGVKFIKLDDKSRDLIDRLVSSQVEGDSNYDRGLAEVDASTAPAASEPPPEEKAEEPKAEEPKAEEPKAEEPKAEEPKAEEPKAEEPKAEEPKA